MHIYYLTQVCRWHLLPLSIGRAHYQNEMKMKIKYLAPDQVCLFFSFHLELTFI